VARLIGLTGLPRSGKDSVAAVLSVNHDFAQMAFATPLKDALIVLLGLNRAHFADHALKEEPIDWIGKSPRELMQTLGTEWGRGLVREDIWIRHAQRRLDNYRRFSASVVVTDVRYPNEADWLRKNGGELWHLLRRQAENVVNLHSSNIPLAIAPGADSVIANDEGLAQLEDRVRQALAGELLVTALSA
jgi:hypothetical protein